MTQSIRNTRRTINGNGVRAALRFRKSSSLSLAYKYRNQNRETNTERLKLNKDGLGSDNTQKESALEAVPNVGSSTRADGISGGIFFQKEKSDEVVSESENNSPAPN